MDKQLIELKNKLHRENIQGLALDIDETLALTVQHWVEQMQILFGNPENLSSKEIIDKYRYVNDIPYWQGEEVSRWIVSQIESNEVQKILQPTLYATAIVNKIHISLPIVAYISTRIQSTLSGTLEWLNAYNFPTAEIILRPNTDEYRNWNIWKAEIIEYLYPQVIGIVDDNPNLVNCMSSNYKGTIYLFNFENTIREDIEVIPCKDWIDVGKKIKKK
ncbi:hypothetical protein KBD45_08395 [Candidatus Dojkabacteria bacterium]|nr:hypothetical protein [Candidatus Dojkabacteria bacterium]